MRQLVVVVGIYVKFVGPKYLLYSQYVLSFLELMYFCWVVASPSWTKKSSRILISGRHSNIWLGSMLPLGNRECNVWHSHLSCNRRTIAKWLQQKFESCSKFWHNSDREEIQYNFCFKSKVASKLWYLISCDIGKFGAIWVRVCPYGTWNIISNVAWPPFLLEQVNTLLDFIRWRIESGNPSGT